jgi:hypothetical protein
MSEQFDFSKQEDQEKFDELSRADKNKHIERAQEEARALVHVRYYLDSQVSRYVDIRGISKAEKIIETFQFPQKMIHQISFESIKKYLLRGKIDKAEQIQISEILRISQEMLHQAAFEVIKECLFSKNDYSFLIVNQIQSSEILKIPQEMIHQASFEAIKKHLLKQNINKVEKIKNYLKIPQEMIYQASLEVIKKCLSDRWIDMAEKIQLSETLKIPQEMIHQASFEAIKDHLLKRNIDEVEQIQASGELKIPQEMIQQASFDVIKKYLSEDTYTGIIDAMEIQKIFPISREMLQKILQIKEVQQTVLDTIKGIVLSESDEINSEIQDILSFLGLQSLRDIIQSLDISIQSIVSKLKLSEEIDKEEIKIFIDNFEQSLGIQIFIYQNSDDEIVEIIKKYPFLLDAILKNRFGSRLFTAYEGFDKTSKKKIEKLFQWKDEIIEENMGIDQNSLEFRLAMQEKIKIAWKNEEIAQKISSEGIDINVWLQYSETEDFELGGKEIENVSILNMVERPLNRILENTIPKYIQIVRTEIEPYKEDLKEVKMDIAVITGGKRIEIEDKLASMRRALEQTPVNDLNRKNGIKKGIDNLEQQLSKTKEIVCLDKIYASIANIISVAKKLQEYKEKFKEAEEGKEYKKMREIKIKLFRNYKILEYRFQKFQDELKDIISNNFTGHGDAILQAIDTQTAEMLNHLTTDGKDIKKIFEDDDLDAQMKNIKNVELALWNRNPDLDLYLGNYSPCCISVEGGAGWDGSESAVADYLTDVSIQILNLTNKETGDPIMSAWLYLGKDKKGNTAIIIDNIESNALETDLYQKEIWDRVENYITQLAKKINVKKVSMGVDNNDIEPSDIEDDDYGEYRKIGPNNGKGRKSAGYYLESEDERNMYLIWGKE